MMRISRIQVLICLVGFAEAVVYGYSFPYFSLTLESRDLSSAMIGMNAMVGTLGALLVGPVVPTMIARLGYRRFSIAALLVAAVIFAAAAVEDSTPVLFAYRLVLGLALASLWISTEAWLNHVADDDNRGFLNGIFQTCYSFGFFLGPTIASVVGTDGGIGPSTMIVVAVLGILVCVVLRGGSGAVEGSFEAPLDWTVAWRARRLLAVAMLTGVAETAMYTLLHVYGLQIGYPRETALMVLMAYTLGEVVLTLPLGWTADRVDRRKMLAVCGLAASAAVAFLGLSGTVELSAMAMSFLAGGLIVSLYNLALVVVGETYRSTDLPVVSTAFSMAYSVGCASGATVGGLAMDALGPEGLPIAVSLALAVFALASAWMSGLFGSGRNAPVPPGGRMGPSIGP